MQEYIHRVGRTARGLNNRGNAVILLRPEEEEFIKFLEKEKVYLDKYTFGEPPDEVQEMVRIWSTSIAPRLSTHTVVYPTYTAMYLEI